MNIESTQTIKELNELERFINKRGSFSKKDIITWVSNCIALFTALGVSEEIIRGFMESFTATNENRIFCTIESFQRNTTGYILKLDPREIPSENIYYVSIAFTTAKAIIQKQEESESIVPTFLIKTLEDGEYNNVISSLELIEQCYEKKDSDGLMKNTMTLLDSTLNLDETLKNKRNIGSKLSCLLDNENIRNQFGVDKDIIRTLNNARAIRNCKSVHKDMPLEYNIPFIVSVGFASITILFLEITIASGDIFVSKT